MGAAFCEAVLGVERAARGAAVQRRGGDEGHAATCWRRTSSSPAPPRLNFVGNVEGFDDHRRRGRRDRDRRLHRQRRAEGDGGHLGGAAGRDPRAPRCPRRAPKLGGLLLRPALRGLRDELDPEGAGRRVPARAAPARPSSPTAASRARLRPGDRCWPPAACARTSSGAPTRALEAAGALRSDAAARSPRPRRRLACRFAMTREEVLELIRAHLADELEIDPARIEREHALQGRPRGRLARPVHAGAGARGLLRRADARRAGRADPHRRPGRRLRARPRPSRRGPDRCAQLREPARRAPGGPARQVFTHASWTERRARLLRAPRLPGRLRARPGGHHAPVSAPGGGRATAPAA